MNSRTPIRKRTPAEKAARTRRLKARNSVMLEHPRPAQVKVERDAKRWYDADGRLVRIVWNLRHPAGHLGYRSTVELMGKRDGWICCICHEPIANHSEATFEHTDKRGGGRRNDLPEYVKNGRTIRNGVAHGSCNAVLGSKRLRSNGKPCGGEVTR